MMPRLSIACLAFVVLVVCPACIFSRSYSNGLIFYELSSHTPYLPPTVSVSRGRNLASVKYSEKGSIWSTFGQPCECSGPMCSCCAGLKVDQYGFDQKVCANVSFVPQLEEARLEVFLNDRSSSKYGISVRNPAPFCIPVMMGVPMAMCVQMTDVKVVGSNLNMCMDFVVRMATTDLFEMHFQCMRMGTDGLQYVDKNGKPVLPQGQGQQGDDPEEYEYAELEDQPEYVSQEEDYASNKGEENPPQELQAEKEEPLAYPQLQKPVQVVEELKNHTEKTPAQINDHLEHQHQELVEDQPVGYAPLVIEELPLDPQKLEDHRPQEDEDPEPLPIESEMLMAGDQSKDSATEDTEPAEEEVTEEGGKETEAQTEKEVEAGTEVELEEEAPDNDHDNDNDNDNGYGYGSESGPRPQVIETITNSIKATEASTTTTTPTITTTTARPTTKTTTTTPITTTTTTPTTTKIIPIPNIVGIDYTNKGEKMETQEEEEMEDKVKKSSEAEEEKEEEGEGEEEQPEAEEVEGGEATTLAVEMENDSDNEINVDDDNDDYEDHRQVKEPPKQQADNEQEGDDDDDDDEDEEEAEGDDEEEEEEYEGEEAAEETEEAAKPAVKSQRRLHRRRNRARGHPRRLGKLRLSAP